MKNLEDNNGCDPHNTQHSNVDNRHNHLMGFHSMCIHQHKIASYLLNNKKININKSCILVNILTKIEPGQSILSFPVVKFSAFLYTSPTKYSLFCDLTITIRNIAMSQDITQFDRILTFLQNDTQSVTADTNEILTSND